MDQILVEEAEINAKLNLLHEKRKSNKNLQIHLRSVKIPKDLVQFHSELRQKAFKRNSELLQELDIATAKLHTKRLCPLNEKLSELRKEFLQGK